MADTEAALTISARKKLKSIVERVEALNTQRNEIAAEIRDVYAEAKGLGYDTLALRHVITRRAKDSEAVAERESIIDTYLIALGDI